MIEADMQETYLNPRNRSLQTATWLAGVFIALSVAFLAYSVYIVVVAQQGRFDLSDQILMPVAVLMCLASIVSFSLIRRGRLETGSILLFGVVVLIPPIAAVLVLQDFGATSIIYAALMSFFMIQFVLPRRYSTYAIAATFVVIVVALVVEMLNPAFRTGTDIFGFTTALIGVTALVLLIILVRQYKTFSLRTKFIFAFSLTSVAIVIATTLVFYINQRNEALENFRRIARSAIQIAALQQNGDEFAKITSAQDPLYEKLRVQNLKIRRSDPLFIYVFTAAKDSQGLYFVVDAGEPGEENIAAFGERYPDPSATLADNYDTMNSAVADPDIYTDQYGSFLSAYAPIFASDGSRVGVIGLDIDAGTIVHKQRQLADQILIIVSLASLVGIGVGSFFGNRLTKPLEHLTVDTGRFAAGDLTLRTTVVSQDEIGQLAVSFNNMADQIQTLVAGLEQRVADRTAQLRASAEVGRAATSTLDLQQLLMQVADLITDRFGFYYASVFLLDETNHRAVLRAATGEAGQTLLARSHSLPVDDQSMVGTTIITGQPRIALDVGQGAVRFANPLLPNTRSEIALPLRVGARTLGALDVQSKEEGAFDESSTEVLQAMADQIAVALLNAETFQHSERQAGVMALLNELSRTLVTATSLEDVALTTLPILSSLLGESRLAIAQTTANPQILSLRPFTSNRQQPVGDSVSILIAGSLIGESITRGTTIYLADLSTATDQYSDVASYHRQNIRSGVTLPLRVGERALGALTIGSEKLDAYTPEQINQLEQIAAQVAVTIENLNLAEQTQQTLAELNAANRQLVGQAWEKFTSTTRLTAAEWRDGNWWVQDSSTAQRATSQALVPATAPLTLPIRVRGTTIGEFHVTAADARASWDEEDATFAQSLVDQVGQVLETARLLDETERLARRERTINEINARVRQSVDLDAILRTAVAELGQSLKAARVVARVGTTAESASVNSGARGKTND
jgi:GAF domain-containing protein/HAMP domain-containing protein